MGFSDSGLSQVEARPGERQYFGCPVGPQADRQVTGTGWSTVWLLPGIRNTKSPTIKPDERCANTICV